MRLANRYPTFPRPQSAEGPVVLSLGADAGATLALDVSPRRDVQAEVREVAREQSAGGRREGRVAGNMFCSRRKLLRVSSIDISRQRTRRIVATATGEIVDASGEVIGEHSGIHRYTVGQRRGIGIASERPLYVLSIDARKNRVIVGEQEELFSSEFIAAGVNWIALDEPEIRSQREVRVRYRHTAAPATITPLPRTVGLA